MTSADVNLSNVVPVILAGGTGTRLWPVSRALFPKQFHSLVGEHSFLQATMLRALAVTRSEPIIVCNEEHRFLVAEQCREVKVSWQELILEPEGRNSAPAIALAAWAALGRDESALLLVLPSDHLINDAQAFKAAVESAALGAVEGGLVTFGITPDRPETGYGYIKVDGACGKHPALQNIASFVEKPDAKTAEGYVASGNYFWNSGIFLLSARTYVDELRRLQPAMAEATEQAVLHASRDMDFLRPGPTFLECPADSIDYAVMEKTHAGQVLPVSFGWSDIGSWASIWDESPRDADGNALEGDVIAVNTRDTLVVAQKRLVGTLGVKDLVVVETTDAVLVADRHQVQNVREIVARLKEQGREELVTHREVFRPWGSYEGIDEGERYQVKCIKVKPGERLSLQRHHHRSEHWIVVKGTARVTRADEVFDLAENESTYIPRGSKHRLENPGKLMLELIEVQVGPYLGEDDIERFEDIYGR